MTAKRQWSFPRNRVVTLGTVTLVVVAALLVEWLWSTPRTRSACSVPVSEIALTAGTRLSGSMVRFHFFSDIDPVRCSTDYLTESDFDRFPWRTVRPIESGATIRRDWVELADRLELPRGRRAVTLSVPEPTLVQAGDFVDVYTPETDGGPVASRVLVLGRSREAFDSGHVSLILALDPKDIRAVEKARQRGKLTIALRHPQDTGGPLVQTEALRTQSWHSRRRPAKPRSGKIWHEE